MEMICANGHLFEGADVSGGYGEFVMRGESSPTPCFLDALEDAIYTEVENLLRELGIFENLDRSEEAAVLQEFFGLACDPAPDGTVLKIGRNPPCPFCGTHEMASWKPAGPYSGDQLPVTHQVWSQLSTEQKRDLFRFLRQRPA